MFTKKFCFRGSIARDPLIKLVESDNTNVEQKEGASEQEDGVVTNERHNETEQSELFTSPSISMHTGDDILTSYTYIIHNDHIKYRIPEPSLLRSTTVPRTWVLISPYTDKFQNSSKPSL